jgi:hypothetical protein
VGEVDEAEFISSANHSLIEAAMNGSKREAQAALLRKCSYELTGQIYLRGLKLKNAVVVGYLDLVKLAVLFPPRFADANSTLHL